MTDPDWVPIMKRAAAIVTDHGGRTSHAAIVSRELGLPAVVGAGDATDALDAGREITVSCAEGDEGRIYDGIADGLGPGPGPGGHTGDPHPDHGQHGQSGRGVPVVAPAGRRPSGWRGWSS